MNHYKDRRQAGKLLSQSLMAYANRQDVIVLGLPRGGVPVAYEVAQQLKAPLDVFIVRKLGVPGQPELAFGAICRGPVVVYNDDVVREMGLTKAAMNQVNIAEEKELKRREKQYRGHRPFPEVSKKTVILVDDGIATGASMKAAIQSLRLFKPASIIVAVPVAARSTCDELSPLVDQVICPLTPPFFNAVGAWYDRFDQTTDEEVQALLSLRL